MENFKKGQKIVVVGDTFQGDPHGIDLGTILEVELIQKAVDFKDFPPEVQLIYLMSGHEPVDLPQRIHVKLNEKDYANLVFEDVQLYEENGATAHSFSDGAIHTIEMTEDCFDGGFAIGDQFEVYTDESGNAVFQDNDGDERFVSSNDHIIL